MTARPRWLLLMHQLPPHPDYFRVKVWRRLRRIGAVALKNSVYVLPNGVEEREDFEWLAREIVAGGGEATLCEANFLTATSDLELTASSTERRSRQRRSHRPRGALWVTRRGVHVDRIASAWLIRRFIDPEADFKFVDPATYRPDGNELRFDMFDAEYTHIGAACTFEVLLDTFALRNDVGLSSIAEIVHDIDCKDDLFGRAEAGDVACALDELYAQHRSDEARLNHGSLLFENLYWMLQPA
jgi:hypothetical protein